MHSEHKKTTINKTEKCKQSTVKSKGSLACDDVTGSVQRLSIFPPLAGQ